MGHVPGNLFNALYQPEYMHAGYIACVQQVHYEQVMICSTEAYNSEEKEAEAILFQWLAKKQRAKIWGETCLVLELS